jgi:hypothetical protein
LLKNKFKFRFLLSLFGLFFSFGAFAQKAVLLNTKTAGNENDEADAPIMNLFSPEKRPGSGSITLTLDGKVETYELGSKSGLFANALVIHSSALPDGMKQEFAKSHLIQIAMGTLNSHLQHQLPQFGAATLVTKKIPSNSKVFDISKFDNDPKKNDGRAMLMFSPPGNAADQNDEERLKSTFFAKSGNIIMTPLGSLQEVSIQGDSDTYPFKTQKMRLEIRCEMMNPFNPAKSSLAGAVEIFVFWPDGPKAIAFIERVSSKTVGPMLQSPRNVTTAPKSK